MLEEKKKNEEVLKSALASLKPGKKPYNGQPKQQSMPLVTVDDVRSKEIYKNSITKSTTLPKSTVNQENIIPYMKVGNEKKNWKIFDVKPTKPLDAERRENLEFLKIQKQPITGGQGDVGTAGLPNKFDKNCDWRTGELWGTNQDGENCPQKNLETFGKNQAR